MLVEENDNLVPFHCGSYEFSNSNKGPTEEQVVLLEPAALAQNNKLVYCRRSSSHFL